MSTRMRVSKESNSKLFKQTGKWVDALWVIPAVLFWFWLAWNAYLEIKQVRITTGSLKSELVLLGILALVTFLFLWLISRILRARLLQPVERLLVRLGWAGYWAAVILVLILATIFIGYTDYGVVTLHTYIRLVFFFAIALLPACIVPWAEGARFHWPGYLGGVVVIGSLMAFGVALQEAMDYPFQLYWSEGNRFWDYSIGYGRRLYVYPANQPLEAFIDRGRQSLWGLPFLFADITIQQMRLWSVLVFTVPYMLLGWLIFRPTREHAAQGLVLGLWSYLFLDQGPIYTPLVLAAILVVGGRRLPLWLNLLLVALAGYYAQMSRYTWMFAPAIWAAAYAFLVPDSQQNGSPARKWYRAIGLAAAGLLGGFVIPRFGQWLQAAQQGNLGGADLGISGAVTRQPLLWERLWPNPTYPLGILPALILAAGPLLIIVIVWFWRRSSQYNLWQRLAVTGMLAIFLAVGLVASVKIGGGNNLHNLDMFLIGLLISAGIIWEAGAHRWLEFASPRPTWAVALIAFLALYPTAQFLQHALPWQVPDRAYTDDTVDWVHDNVTAASQCGDVLLIDNRQLLTFGYIKNLPLVPDYEKKRMMDEAMADNKAYFEPFYRDLQNQRFAMILTEPLHTGYQGGTHQFGNENDAWVYWVSMPVLEHYEVYATNEDFGIQMLVPREKSCPSLP